MGAVTFSCLLPLIDATKSNLNLSEGQGDAIASLSSVRVVVGDRGVSADSERNHRLFIGGISGQIAATEGIDDVSCCLLLVAASGLQLHLFISFIFPPRAASYGPTVQHPQINTSME